MTNMPAFSRGLRPFLRTDYICSKCLQFSTTSAASSGHNRWSKIKHDKGAVDAKKTKARSIIAHDIALAVKCAFSGAPFTLLMILIYHSSTWSRSIHKSKTGDCPSCCEERYITGYIPFGFDMYIHILTMP